MRLKDMLKPEQKAMLESLRDTVRTGPKEAERIEAPAVPHANWKSIPKSNMPSPVPPTHPKIQLQRRTAANPTK